MDGTENFGILNQDDDVFAMMEQGSSPLTDPATIVPAGKEVPPAQPAKATPPATPTLPAKEEGVEEKEFDPLADPEEEASEEEGEEGKSKGLPKKAKAEPKKKEDAEEEEPEAGDENEFTILAKDFAKMGILELGEDEELPTTDVELRDKVVANQKNMANKWINSIVGKYGDEGINMFKAIFVNGVAPQDYLEKYNSYADVADLDITEESAQEEIVRQYYLKSGLPAASVDKKIQKLKDTLDLEEEAKTFHPILVEAERKQLADLEAKAERDEQNRLRQEQAYKASVEKILSEKLKTKDFDGIPVTDKVAEEAFHELTAPRWKAADGKTLTDFDKFYLDLQKEENYPLKVKIWMLKKLLDKDPTLSTIKKKGVSEESSAIFTQSRRTTAHNTNKGKGSQKETIPFI